MLSFPLITSVNGITQALVHPRFATGGVHTLPTRRRVPWEKPLSWRHFPPAWVFHNGTADGTLDGSRFSVQIYWQDGSVGAYTGEIAPSGRINGETYDRFHSNNRAQWYSKGVMKCAAAPAETNKSTRVLGKRTPQPQTGDAPRPLSPSWASGVEAASGITSAMGSADVCKSGFVWREARPSDHVCVTPDSRRRVAQENRTAASRRDPNGAYGPASCKQGFVWREAFESDTVCVTPEVRAEVSEENRVAATRMSAP
jgi:hypothetical protein